MRWANRSTARAPCSTARSASDPQQPAARPFPPSVGGSSISASAPWTSSSPAAAASAWASSPAPASASRCCCRCWPATGSTSVIGLIGERGREVREFIEETLGEEGMRARVVVVATSDEPALKRRQAAYMTMAIAEYFRDQDLEVLCLMDSVTRFAMAQREIGLAAGEPPTTKGYTPTCFTELPRLLERAGPGRSADGTTDHRPVHRPGRRRRPQRADRRRRARHPGRPHRHGAGDRRARPLPAINILRSVSRTMPGCNTTRRTRRSAGRGGALRLQRHGGDDPHGGLSPGHDPLVDEAIEYNPAIEEFLKQGKRERTDMDTGYAKLAEILNVPWP